MVANATGCSSIYGGSAPATPYCRNYRSGFGPAWANSLFEDNAEFGLGMATATRQMRDRVERIMKEGLACDCCSAEIKALFTEWIENRECTLKTKEIADKLIPLMEKCGCDICKQLLELRHSLVKKSQWIFGGDGWGYDPSRWMLHPNSRRGGCSQLRQICNLTQNIIRICNHERSKDL